MWIRKRLDISKKDLLTAISFCFTTGSRISLTRKIQTIWEKEDQKCFTCLSVRTGFDLLFQALNFAHGSEIIMSALTIPDMSRIIVHHGLIPVPLDLDIGNLSLSAERIEAALTPKTKAIVIAHLFGGIHDLTEIKVLAEKYNILVIEDCAQAFYSGSFSGKSAADISMFSFGTIKTATALGGGILIFRNNDQLLTKIQKIHEFYPIQRRRKFLIKALKYLFLTFLFSPGIYSLIIKRLEKKGVDYDSYIHGLSRSFPNGNFFEQIRKQPSLPLLKLMNSRFNFYDFSIIEKRMERGRMMARAMPESLIFPGSESTVQTFWAFPVLTLEPLKLVAKLKKAGFDATHKSSLEIIELPENNRTSAIQIAESILNQIVFLPLYPEIPLSEFKRMVEEMCINKNGIDAKNS